MKTDSRQLCAKSYISDFAASGRCHFLSSDALGVCTDATKLALNRLARQNMTAQPARGFYVIVPLEYRFLECLPAAQYHGVAHHRPQEFQVLLERERHPISCGQVRATFIVCKRLQQVPVQSFDTPRGLVRASAPKATAVDLVGYSRHVGGPDLVATVLLELAEQIDPQKLLTAAQSALITWAKQNFTCRDDN